MNYFPAFISLDNKKVLLVGGGVIAHEKLLHLLDFTRDIFVIAKEFSSEMLQTLQKHNLPYEQRGYKEGDIKDMAIVIIAVDDIPLQKTIYDESQNYKCLCNAVDSVDYCDFIFPSYIKDGDLTVAVSTSGASPAVAKHLRIYLQNLIPDTIASFLREMRELRTTLPKGKERMVFLEKKAKEFFLTLL